MILPPLESITVAFTEVRVRKLFSDPQIILSAVPGIARFPEFIVWHRDKGAAYTVGSATNLQLVINAVVYDSVGVSSLLTSGVGPYRRIATAANGGGSPYGAMAAATSSRDDTNQAMSVRIQGGDLADGLGTLTIAVFYRAWDLLA